MSNPHICPCCQEPVTDPDRWESDDYDGLCESCEIWWIDDQLMVPHE